MGGFRSGELFDWTLIVLGFSGIILFGSDLLIGITSDEVIYSSEKHGLMFFGPQALVMLGSLCALSILLLAVGAIGLWRRRCSRS